MVLLIQWVLQNYKVYILVIFLRYMFLELVLSKHFHGSCSAWVHD